MLRRLRSDNQRLNVDYNTYRLTIYRLILRRKRIVVANCSEKLNQDIELSVHEKFMNEALRLARKAASLDEVPIGCVIVKENQIIGRGFNEREVLQKSTAHSEIIAIEQACKQTGFWRLDDCDLYVTLEPCPMCAGAIIQSRIRNVYFGAYDPKGGSCGSVVNLLKSQHIIIIPIIWEEFLRARMRTVII